MVINTTRTNVSYVVDESRYGKIVCYPQEFLFEKREQKAWESGSTMASALPFLVTQLLVSNLSYRVIYYLTRPLYLPPFVAQILCGLLYSPSVLGNKGFIIQYVFPYRFTMILETFANLALVYNIFLLGLGMDLRMVRLTELKPLVIAAAGLLVSLPVGIILYFLPGNGAEDKILAGSVFWAVALSCTNFPDLARILADLKLLRTDMGKIAMSSAIVTDVCTWVLLVLGFSVFSKAGTLNKMMPFVLLSTGGFALFCIFVIRPTIAWFFSRTAKTGHTADSHIWFILSGVVFCGLVTDACGTHSITGAFLFGLSIPHDHLIRNMIEEKLHDFLSGILMPLFYIICGLRADLQYMLAFTDPVIMAVVITSSFSLKILTTVIVSLFMRMPARDALALGCLMNTKGILALVVLNAGRDTKALDSPMYTHMTVVFLVMSLIVEPLLAFAYKPKKPLVHYKHRTIQRVKGETEFRVMACVHALPNVFGITNLLQTSHRRKQSPLNVFAIHLVELTGRTTASMLIMNDECKPKANFSDRVRAQSDQIAESFETLELHDDGVMVQTITAVSPYTTMHEDICALAEDKRVCFIILPYHKQMTSDGRMGEGNASHADINQNVLNHAPCSVGILVDRGMGMVRTESFPALPPKTQVAMLFVGGADDREALSYAWRMVGQDTVKLTLLRFVPGRDALVLAGKAAVAYEKEKQVDDECIYEFNFKTTDDSSVTYIEKVVNDGQGTIATIREMEDRHSYDLYIVGRGCNDNSPVTDGLTDWSSSPELGSIGDTLASSKFTMHASVLVIQQYSATNRHGRVAAAAAADGGGDGEGDEKEPVKTPRDAEPFMKSIYDEDDEEEEYKFAIHK
ncbi:PREDICTED: cation/H(+) antiporter 23, chloroplastic-like [Tarenaya hassleriana]|uniref:cation/H(+) antiporter 23, chloroplastic-like n=1 Tax=Tarenaya hassleriana TaxID=28532 RepID=UPI00053CA297|nr:PREDICTED: cation/H(+) antiporter 23, chloroplastic-like [Tarenaya hassleriana]